MPSLIKINDWKPEGVLELEAAADRVVRSLENRIVMAGPGAGKTELLAQRASYLLRTGLCPFPKRILAISFKRDAAKNLKERIQLRCGPELSSRFDSYTFDAFAKGLFDRFVPALPSTFRPEKTYAINFDINERNISNWLKLITIPEGISEADFQAIQSFPFYWKSFLGNRLAVYDGATDETDDVIARALWSYMLKESDPPQLNFAMIGRLAELMLRQNPMVLAALRSTYGFVFLDEFQDTTQTQFDLTVTAFKNSSAILTAVGDDKQRIMVWAGALNTVFQDFKNEFGASSETLLLNHRSAPELVRIQSFFVQMLDPNAPPAEASKNHLTGECRVLVFKDHQSEARIIGRLISEWLNDQGLRPRDICILTRNRPSHYVTLLIEQLANLSIKARIETEIQDLLAEPLVVFLVALLKVCLSGRAQSYWTTCVNFYFELHGIDQDSSRARDAEVRIANFLRNIRNEINATASNEEAVKTQLNRLMSFVGETRFKNTYPQYLQGDWYHTNMIGLARELAKCRASAADWLSAINDFEGKDCVPIMTVHKSKGLEYHTVIFVGLEDSALWTFQNSPEEEKRTFFVALSRAMERVIFTFCKLRERPGRGVQVQARTSIGVLYDLLAEAGVNDEQIEVEDE